MDKKSCDKSFQIKWKIQKNLFFEEQIAQISNFIDIDFYTRVIL
jgi:hypothetical protein